MNEVDEIFESLSPEEREAVMTILREQAEGKSESLNKLYAADYEEIPVDIDTFLESDHYLGKSTDRGQAIYPYWRKAYREIIEQDKVECALGGSIGCGKGLTLDTPLLGPDGYFPMRDAKVGDKILGQDGKCYNITGVYPQGVMDTYKITFNDGTYVECDINHLWNIKEKLSDKNYITKSTRWLIDNFSSYEQLYIPVTEPLTDVNTFNMTKGGCLSVLLTVLSVVGYIENRRVCFRAATLEKFNKIRELVEYLGGIVMPLNTPAHDGYMLLPFHLMSYVAENIPYHSKDEWRFELPVRYMTKIEYIGKQHTQCIMVDNPESLYLIKNCIVTHNTTAAVYLMSYFVYKLMCLKNIRQFYGLEGNGPISVCFLNNTIKLSQGVAYDKFMSTLATSPWFLERGEVRGTVNIRYKPNKNIDFIVGSSADQIIGRDVFCLAGDTKIPTEFGLHTLEELAGKEVKVFTLNDQNKLEFSDKPCKIVCTKETNVLVHIYLPNGKILKCTPEHRFLMATGEYEEAGNLIAGDLLYSTCIETGVPIQDVFIVKYHEPQPVFDVINVPKYSCFAVDVTDGELSACMENNIGFIISHNCAILDEVNFSKGADIQFEKNKVLETYNACYGRIKNRFTVNGKCQGRIFLVSSKKTEYDFMNQYIEKKMQSVEDSKHLFVADAKAFEVKPKGSYSGKMFRVAVGGSNLESKIPTDDESTEELIHQGYEVYDVPVELRGDFELDINRFIADHLGISVSEVIKFIPYSMVEQCYKDITNPFTKEVFEANLKDTMPIKAYFRPELISEGITNKPIFIHLDTSGGKKDNCGVSAIAAMGFVNRNRYSEASGQEETTKQMLYRQIFSIGLNAKKNDEISYQKLVDFLWYLKYELGWNIKAVSTDGYMGQFLRQQISAAVGGEVNYISLDRTPEGYLAFQSILAEQRIAMLKLHLLESEIVRLERNNVTGKVDHPPIDGCFIGSTQIKTNKGNIAIEELVHRINQGESIEAYSYSIETKTFQFKPIKKAWLTKYVNTLCTVHLASGSEFTCTPEHKILLEDDTYIPAQQLLGAVANWRFMKNDPKSSHLSNKFINNVSIEHSLSMTPVYDIEVEDNHNFVLSCGIIAHNSKDIADSLAGALYNASLHEATMDFGTSELIDTIVDMNKPTPKTTNSDVRLVSKINIPESNTELKANTEEVPNIHAKADFEKQWAMRQGIQYHQALPKQEEPWDPRDMIIDV